MQQIPCLLLFNPANEVFKKKKSWTNTSKTGGSTKSSANTSKGFLMASAAVSFQKKSGIFISLIRPLKKRWVQSGSSTKEHQILRHQELPFGWQGGSGLLFRFNNCAGFGWLNKRSLKFRRMLHHSKKFFRYKILSKKNIEMCFRCKSIFDAVGEFCYQIIFGFKI